MSFRHRFPLLRPLAGLLLFTWLCMAPGAWAQAPDDPAAEAKTQLNQADKELKAIRTALPDAETRETLTPLFERAMAVQRDADDAQAALQPELDQLDTRLTQLGTVPEGTVEAREVAQQRKSLTQQRADIAAAVARAKLLAVDAKQLGADIEKMRVTQLSEDLARKVNSPLSPSLWRKFARDVPTDLQELGQIYRQAETTARKAIAQHGWTAPLTGLAVALLLFFPLRLWLRAAGRRYAASERAPDGRLRRSGLAVWLLVVGTMLPGLACVVFFGALDAIGAIPPRLEKVVFSIQVATYIAAFITALSAALLVPKRPSWRLLNLDDTAAWRLRKYAWGAAALTWISIVLMALNRAARTSAITTVAVDGLIAITYMALIIAILVSLARLHRRQTDEAAAKLEAQAQSDGKAKGPPRRSGWIVIARLAGHVVVAAAVIATLLGYLNLALFVAQQLVWGAVVLLAASLLMKFADDLATWLLCPTSSVGRTVLLTTGLSESRVVQAGVLLSAGLRICVILLAVMALTAPLGNLSALYGGLDTLSKGIRLGDNLTLKPSSVLYAALAFVLVWAVMQAFQRWLTDTYLPKTDLDAGARNSISTVTRYLGIIAAVLWSLTALGIGFERLALVVSALSVGIGFGLQAITQNFVSGLILLAERPVKIGDWVKLGDQEGDIKRINVRSTEIQVGDKSTLIVPNSELITKTIRNMTMGNAQGRIQIQFTVPLSTDVAMVRQTLLDAYTDHVGVLADPAPSVFIDSIANGQVAINSFAYTSGPRAVYGVRSDLYFTMLQKFAAAGIALSSPTDIHLVHEPAPQRDP